MTNSTLPAYNYQAIPARLRDIPHWILWRREWQEHKQKWNKVPIQTNGYGASKVNPAHFNSFDNALLAYNLGTGDGIGFCFTGTEGLVFVDLDGAIKDGQWDPFLLQVAQQFPTWGEYSMSGSGVHLICEGQLDRTRTHRQQGLELYGPGSFMAVTGWTLDPRFPDVTPQQGAVDALAAYIDSQKPAGQLVASGDPMPEPADPVPLDQLRLSQDIHKFLESGDASKWDSDRSRALLAASLALYRAGLTDAQVLGTLWHWCGYIAQEHRTRGDAMEWLWRYSISPAQGAKPPSPDAMFAAVPTSEPDRLQKLIQMADSLTTGSVADTDTIHQARALLAESLQLDAGSAIALQDAIRRAMTWTKTEMSTVLKEIHREVRRQGLAGHGGVELITDSYLYVAGLHVFLHKESGEILRPEAFVALHSHITDEIRDIVLSGEGVAKVTSLDFDPGMPETFTRNGATYYNTWTGLTTTGTPGDITPWWRHLCLLVPVTREREHLLNWMAYTVQHPEKKINHAVVMGGHFGIGKDTLFWPLDQLLGRHSKQVGGDVLTRDFNDFLSVGKLITLQEVEMGTHKEAKMIDNRLKPMIASPPDTLYINPKGTPAYHIRNVAHIVMFHNGDDPVIINEGDRRYFVLSSSLRIFDPETGEQRPEWASYFDALWSWLDDQSGWQYVAHYLLNRDISQFNPKAAPPMTEGKAFIIEHNRTGTEAMIARAIEDRTGPFAQDALTIEALTEWLSTEGTSLLYQYGVKEVPSPVVLGRALRAAGGVCKRLRVEKSLRRVWVVRYHDTLLQLPGDLIIDYLAA